MGYSRKPNQSNLLAININYMNIVWYLITHENTKLTQVGNNKHELNIKTPIKENSHMV